MSVSTLFYLLENLLETVSPWFIPSYTGRINIHTPKYTIFIFYNIKGMKDQRFIFLLCTLCIFHLPTLLLVELPLYLHWRYKSRYTVHVPSSTYSRSYTSIFKWWYLVTYLLFSVSIHNPRFTVCLFVKPVYKILLLKLFCMTIFDCSIPILVNFN